MEHNRRLLSQPVIAALRGHLSDGARLLLADDPDYALGRKVWNAGIDRHPAAILVCGDAEDAALAVRVAANHGVVVTVRGGGHNVAGRSVQDGALLLDLSRMRRVEVNAHRAVVTAQGGALWHDLDTATQRFGLATTGGMVSSTGVGGLTMGGGSGWLMRRHGLAIDNLKAADVVLADSRIVRASAEEHPDLFWALRGGAGGLGVVTSFEFQLHPLTQVLAGLVVRPASAAAEVLREFRDFTAAAPDEFCSMTVLAHAPPLPFLDPQWHGQPVVISALCWCGDLAAGERILAPLRASAHHSGNTSGRCHTLPGSTCWTPRRHPVDITTGRRPISAPSPMPPSRRSRRPPRSCRRRSRRFTSSTWAARSRGCRRPRPHSQTAPRRTL